jgi:cysteinyl-tRNA synthetase
MITLIERLIANGCAYVEQGHVLFRVAAMPDYGKLSNRSLDEMIAGARVEVAPYKHDPMDFVLWKPSETDEPGWDSPWGRGRPGWHIECSAMSAALLGETFDIHGGGIDLVFPHHENEIAQSRCAFHTPVMANYWMHNGFLQVEGEKMAKSAGNFVTVRELLSGHTFGGRSWDATTIRLAMLRTHYRQPIDWTTRALEEADKTIRNWANLLERHQTSFGSSNHLPVDVLLALTDDLNTPMALGEMHKLAEQARKGDFASAQELHQAIEFLVTDNPLSAADQASISESAGQLLPNKDEIEFKVDARNAARKAKDFKEADRIRDELAAMGIVLKDSKDGTTWEVAR